VFVLLNVYATVLTDGRVEKEAEELRSHLKGMLRESGRMTLTEGELALKEASGRKISASVFARALRE